jgi:hypothetical protein
MSRSLRMFLIAYAAVMIACTASLGKDIFSEVGGTWFLLGYAAVSYLALALGYAFIDDRDRAPGGITLAAVFVAALSLPLALGFGFEPLKANPPVTLAFLIIVPYLACMGLLLHRLKGKQERQQGTAWQACVLVTLGAGAVLVLASLALKTTINATGWNVIAFREKWITSGVNVATGIFGPEIRWLQPFYKPGGYLFYSLGLIATVVMLIRLVFSRMKLNRACESRLFRGCLLAINISCFWLLTDIFWGWHFDFSSFPVTAAIATVLWLTGPLFAILLVVPLVWKENDLWRLQALLALQVPVAAFNLAMLGMYWGTDGLDMPGLGLLIIGLLLESLASIEVLASRTQARATIHELQPEDAAQTHLIAA